MIKHTSWARNKLKQDGISDLFSPVEFDKKNHSYAIRGKPLKSVTQIVSEYSPDTNWVEVAKKVAAKDGSNPLLILKAWKEKGELAMNNGTLVHEYIEYMLKETEDPIPLSLGQPALPEMDAFDDFLLSHPELEPVMVEWRIGDYHYGVGGTIDCLMWDRKEQCYSIFDWKTGDKFTTQNVWQTLKSPLDDLEDCKWITYSLQLSFYKLILQRNTNLKLGNSWIIHLTNTWTVYPAIDYTDIIKDRLFLNI